MRCIKFSKIKQLSSTKEKSSRDPPMFSVKDVLKATQARLLHGNSKNQFKGVSTDTRSLKEGELFIAIKGEKFYVHQFLDEAILKKASGLMVSEDVPRRQDLAIFKVKDT